MVDSEWSYLRYARRVSAFAEPDLEFFLQTFQFEILSSELYKLYRFPIFIFSFYGLSYHPEFTMGIAPS